MTKIDVWDEEEQRFLWEQFVVNSDNFLTTASAYCKHIGTTIERKTNSAVTLANGTILSLSKISKFKTRNLTKIGVTK